MNDNSTRLGAHIPLVYHFAMLQDQHRVSNFKRAIDIAVAPGARVLELGGGTGILSFFAAQKASKVYCVERIPENAEAAKRFLRNNPNGEKVEVICADAFTYLPPEPVDVVICEMLHVGMVREQQVGVIESFKRRYQAQFGGQLPRFVPEAFIQAIQPISYNFDFFGYDAPVVVFQAPGSADDRCIELAEPLLFQTAEYRHTLAASIEWDGLVTVQREGRFNATRWILKNVLTIIPERNEGVFWHNQYMILPNSVPVQVKPGERLNLSLTYQVGCEIADLDNAIRYQKFEARRSRAAQVEVITEESLAHDMPIPESVYSRVSEGIGKKD